MISIQEIDHLLENNGAVLDSDGDKIGKVEQVFVGDKSQEPQWVTAKTGLFGHSETFIPLEKASIDGSNVRVPYDKAMIKDAPRTDDMDGHLDPDQETELYRYYGLSVSGQPSADDGGRVGPGDGTGQESGRTSEGAAPGAAAAPAPSAGDAGGIRLRKYKVRENVTMTVPVEREEVRVVQVPDVDADADADADRSGSAADTASVARSTSGGSQAPRGSGEQATSEGFGQNEYDQIRGPQSEDLQHPRGTAEGRPDDDEHAGGSAEEKAAPREEDPHAGEHGRHAR